MKIGILKPEEAAKRALANVAKFKKERARKALEANGKPASAAEEKKSEPVSKVKGKLNGWLLAAAYKGKMGEVERLLKAGADVNAADKDGWSALIGAAFMGRENVVKLLIEKGARADARTNDGQAALMYVAGYGFIEVAELLIRKGADVNAKADDGQTALGSAENENRAGMVALLKKHGATE